MNRSDILRSIGVRINKPTFTIPRVVLVLAVLGVAVANILKWKLPKPLVVGVILAGLACSLYDALAEKRRVRPRRRMRDYTMLCIALCAVSPIMLAVVFSKAGSWLEPLIVFSVVFVLSAFGAVWCYMRWRRLRAEAEARLWQLKNQRRRRPQNL